MVTAPGVSRWTIAWRLAAAGVTTLTLALAAIPAAAAAGGVAVVAGNP